MFKHILLPTDGSELSAAATHQGILFAKSIRAKVTGLCVMPLYYKFPYAAGIPTEALGGVSPTMQGPGRSLPGEN
jgi:nucleotide-binding universal stress UspA family protein